MKKKTGIFLIIGIVLALMLTGCGKQSVETETAHTTEEDKLQIGRSKCAGGRRRSGGTDFSD